MKLSLKVRLIVSYILISLFLVASLLFIGRYILDAQFKNYIKDNNEKNINNIVEQVNLSYADNGKTPSDEVFRNIGENALGKGLILTIKDNNGDTIWCMDCEKKQQCSDMLTNMEKNMSRIYPSFKGEYMEKTYEISKGKDVYGSVTLGYYGPFYYNNDDLQFITVFNKVFIIGAILALISAVILGIFMANRLTTPIKKVIEQTGRIEKGNYSDSINFTSNTYEVDKLIKSVNRLASTLDKQLIIRKRLARDYAHELRTPLAALQSNLEAMIDGIWEPTKERLESCNNEILRLTRMISGISKLVEVEEDNIKLNKSVFNINHLLSSIITNFEPALLEKEINIKVKSLDVCINGDRDKIGQVIVNLISNAIKYSSNNGSIKVNLIDKGHNVEISVIDNGIGISSEDIPYIFEHLYRADKSRFTEGCGVGLSIVKGIVDAHKGEIKVRSKLLLGSKFTVILPKE